MRKLNEFYRALSAFLSDPAGHVSSAWSTVKGAIDPEAYNAEALSKAKTLKDAVVVIDTAVAAVVYFLKQKGDEPEQSDLAADEQKAAS